MKDPFAQMETLYDDRDVLTINHHPETVVGRDDEGEKLGSALNAAKNGFDPSNVFIYGKTGVGKTAVTNHVLDFLETYTDFTRVQVTCHPNSSYVTSVDIVNELREDTDRDKLPDTGFSSKKIYNTLYDELNRRDKPAIIVLDEIDNLGDDNQILYKLPRATDNNNLEGDTSVGVIGISNDFTFRDNLSPKIKGSLGEKEIFFEPYTADQLQKILEQRVGKALGDTSILDDAVLPLCAAHARKEHGSARQAIELLRESIDLANERGQKTIGEGVVNDAHGRVQKSQIRDAISGLTDHTIFALVALGYESEECDGAVRSKKVYKRYKKLTNLNNHDDLVYRRFRDQLDELALQGFASKQTKNNGGSGGRYNQYEVSHPYSVIVEAVSKHRDWALFDPDELVQSTLN